MALLGNAITILSVVVGVLAGASAYHASLALPDEQLVGLTLAASAGVELDEKGKPKPLFKTGTQLDVDNLKKLRAEQSQVNGDTVSVKQVKVNEFSLSRWQGKWQFLLAVVGMIGGAVMVRNASSKQAATLRESGRAADLVGALSAAADRLEQIKNKLAEAENPGSELHNVVAAVSELSADLQTGFIDQTEVLRSQLAIGPMAELMERFAGAERFTNRARSTAVDHDPHESLACLGQAAIRMRETAEQLQAVL